ncbi:MAG: FAD-dependent oxidoreductase [Pseudomonadota bacterium]
MGTFESIQTAEQILDAKPPLIVIIGNGPVGVHFANQLIKSGWPGCIKVFGEEACQSYNRVLLSAFLNGEVSFDALNNPIVQHSEVLQLVDCRIEKIEPARQRVLDQYGQWYDYDKLVLATGSSPHIPKIPGRELNGVYRFRDMQDTEALFARRIKSRHTIVVGGGLLGLETAKAMLKHSTQVTLVQHTPTLMNRQLDEEASHRIQRFAEQAGISFRMDQRVTSIGGTQHVENVQLHKGDMLECDSVIFATGIVPNIELARAAKLKVRQGIQIDAHLQTSEPNVFAIGECADFEGQVFGLVGPGLEQASVLAGLLTDSASNYQGSTLITELKVLGLPVFSMGKVTEEFAGEITHTWEYQADDIYRRLFLRGNRVIGAIAIGSWEEIKPVQAAIQKEGLLWPWQKWNFNKTGRLFDDEQSSLENLPDATLICNCQQVDLGQIRTCLIEQKTDFDTLQQQLGVSTTCGSCKPLVQQLLNEPIEQQPIRFSLLGMTAIAALLLSVIIFLPALPASESVQTPGWDWLWTDSLARQISGFTMLGLITLSFLFSARKRFKKFSWLSFDFWRGLHSFLIILVLVTLMLHTGFSFGEGINQWLIINFVAIVLIGIGSAVLASVEGNLANTRIKQIKRTFVWGHIITFWPLPVLLSYHILSVYYF